ncbi:terminase small subunit [Mesorhizobium sp. M1A.F.Ca.IN.020.06.1.1]|uniref:terminase small subunit n=1 Tax=unclassified Mesorhizobium TaxID=325217 RepID=UPI000FCC40D8|nr:MULTISPECIES: terminase small subunit [unclassified Mesorhizobium]RUV90257.1 terminase small subunit [Mesorhizobium sp. M1A.F.Ca.IN.020.32.1.1]RUW12732.1 terminase small subunit [Mesorhizobium sp. M1A.F.Ca.IN.022.05.2.1]RUW32303.1 terminase small subunit [Mesorhizobium sp. M1A.F.Ca.IN.020.06.1.1]RWF82266.1 MAG: terminase small subunit [Mesorhizobium sp.]RWG04187.1 MAG: terminase small subunit [Mesorhizobium sp.]
MPELTPKQALFVNEYLVDLNATAAAKRAGYSELTAQVQGSRLLSNVMVAQAIAARQAAIADRLGVTQEKIVAELAKIAFADIRKAVRWGKSPVDTKSENADPNGLGVYPVELVPSETIDDDTAAAVSEVSLTQTGIKIKMHDKKSALVDLGKHLGMFKERVEHTGKDGAPLVPVLNVRLSRNN